MSWHRLAVWGDAGGREQDRGCRHGGCRQIADPTLRCRHRVRPVRNTCGDGGCGTGHRWDFPAEKERAVSDIHRSHHGCSVDTPPPQPVRGITLKCRGSSVTFPSNSFLSPGGSQVTVREAHGPCQLLAPQLHCRLPVVPAAELLQGRRSANDVPPRVSSAYNTLTPTSAHLLVTVHHRFLRKRPGHSDLLHSHGLTLPCPWTLGTWGGFDV